MFTLNGAYASFEEGIKVSIPAGKLADLVVLDREPRTVSSEVKNKLRAEPPKIGRRVVFGA